MSHPQCMPKNETIPWLEPEPIDIIIDWSGPHGDKLIGNGADSTPKEAEADANNPSDAFKEIRDQRRKLLAKGDNAKYCNKFLIAYSHLYASLFGRRDAILPDKTANELIPHLEKNFVKLEVGGKPDGKAAKARADRGEFVIAALSGSPGHVMVVIEGPGKILGKEKLFYPQVMGGGKGGGYSDGTKTAGDAWNPNDRPKVKYYVLKQKSTPKPAPKPAPVSEPEPLPPK